MQTINNKTIVRLADVNFSYNHELALDKISLEIKRGDFVGIIGPNGSGKTTLLKIILGLLKPKSGDVYLFSQKMSDFNQWQKIGYLPQKATFFKTHFPITVEEVVSLGRISQSKFFYKFKEKDYEAVRKALQVVQMEKYAKKLISDLSGGEQQRIFIAKALASGPELLILDEPTTGVDVKAKEKFYQLLKQLNEELNLTLVLISHDIDVICKEVKTVLCLNRKLVYHGTAKKFIKDDYLTKLYGKNVRFIPHNH